MLKPLHNNIQTIESYLTKDEIVSHIVIMSDELQFLIDTFYFSITHHFYAKCNNPG